VLAFYAVIFIVSTALVIRAVVDPHAATHGYRGPGSLVSAVILIPATRPRGTPLLTLRFIVSLE